MESIRLRESGPRPYVRFETRSAEDGDATYREGRKIYKDIDWVIVTPSGSKDCHEDEAQSWLKKIESQSQNGRYDYEWVKSFKEMYSLYKQGKEAPENGMPLKMCVTLFSPSEIANCAGINIRTLEDLASANEESLGRLGMGARALKIRAQEALKTGEGKESAMRVEALEVQNADLKQKVADLISVVEELKLQSAASEERRGPGRPPKAA